VVMSLGSPRSMKMNPWGLRALMTTRYCAIRAIF
jgi:hypothetical protein